MSKDDIDDGWDIPITWEEEAEATQVVQATAIVVAEPERAPARVLLVGHGKRALMLAEQAQQTAGAYLGMGETCALCAELEPVDACKAFMSLAYNGKGMA